jgi:hypothetical protein
MTAIVATIDVDRAADVVFDYATDPTRFHEWQKGVVEAKLNSAGPPSVGDLCLTVRKIGMAKRPSTSELVRLDPPHAWSARGIDGPIRAIVDVIVEPINEQRTHLSISVDFEGHGIGKALVPMVVRREATKEMPGNLEALKRRLEEG